MAENRQLYGLAKPHAEKKEPKPHPFKAAFRHELWSLDIRYIGVPTFFPPKIPVKLG